MMSVCVWLYSYYCDVAGVVLACIRLCTASTWLCLFDPSVAWCWRACGCTRMCNMVGFDCVCVTCLSSLMLIACVFL